MAAKKVIITICMIFITAVLISGWSVQSSCATGVKKDYCSETLLKLQGIKSLMQRKDVLTDAVRKCPKDAMLLYYYAFNLERRQQYEQALHFYRASTKQDNLFPDVFFGIGETYFSLGELSASIDAYKQGLKIQPDNKWGKGRIKEIIALKNNPPISKSNQTTTTITGSRIHPDKYTAGIADRYGISLEDMVQARKRMSSLKAMAKRYGIQLDELIKANRKSSPLPARVEDSGDANTTKKELEKTQTKYLDAISKRYGIQLDELTKLNDQMSDLKSIADRYGIRIDELIPPGKEIVSFGDKQIAVKKHKVLKNEYLSEIAIRYGVSLKEIVQENKEIPDPHWIFPGQIIKIPEKKNR
jgi:LysM repeat protein